MEHFSEKLEGFQNVVIEPFEIENIVIEEAPFKQNAKHIRFKMCCKKFISYFLSLLAIGILFWILSFSLCGFNYQGC